MKQGTPIWTVGTFTYTRAGVTRHGWRIKRKGVEVARRTGFITHELAETALVNLADIMGEWRRVRARRIRVREGGR